MSALVQKYDAWLKADGPAALVTREPLVSVEGPDGVVFPATFAASEDGSFKGGYNIDELPDGTLICLVDSVGSQANRIEPLFAEEPYRSLVPQITIKAGIKEINLLEAGHRAGDAIVRSSELQEVLQAAFKKVLDGDVTDLAKIAPTSLVFGVWDSRDTQAKLPRLLASTVRAYDVVRLTRSAQYVPAVDYIGEGLLEDTDDKRAKDAYSQKGFSHVPSSKYPGGVIARGGVRRDVTLHLAALRLLRAGPNADDTLGLRRYILGLALAAFTAPAPSYLRQGCNLVPSASGPREMTLVSADGKRESLSISQGQALEFAQEAARAFGVGKDRSVQFEVERAKAETSGVEAGGKAKGKGKTASKRK